LVELGLPKELLVSILDFVISNVQDPGLEKQLETLKNTLPSEVSSSDIYDIKDQIDRIFALAIVNDQFKVNPKIDKSEIIKNLENFPIVSKIPESDRKSRTKDLALVLFLNYIRYVLGDISNLKISGSKAETVFASSLENYRSLIPVAKSYNQFEVLIKEKVVFAPKSLRFRFEQIDPVARMVFMQKIIEGADRNPESTLDDVLFISVDSEYSMKKFFNSNRNQVYSKILGSK